MPNQVSVAGVVELLTVSAGSMELRVGDDRLLLKAGDKATYSADQLHEYRATTSQKCELLLVIDSSAVLRR
jgi:quercetin dioxygenase-like cupin family protein